MKITKGTIFSIIGGLLCTLIGAIFDSKAMEEDIAEEVTRQLNSRNKKAKKD